MTQHSPGPWHVRTTVRFASIHDADGRCVASTGSAYYRGEAVCLANAHVLAASLDLIALAEEAVAFHEAIAPTLRALRIDVDGGPDLARWRAILRKARGMA